MKSQLTTCFRQLKTKDKLNLEGFLFALGIRHVGESAAGLLATHYGTWDVMKQAIDEAQNYEGQAWDDL